MPRRNHAASWIRWIPCIGLTIAMGISSRVSAESDTESWRYWPQWRGPWQSGVAPRATPPQTWAEDQHIRWKVPLEGKGHSTPIIWGDRIFLTAAVPIGEPVEPRHTKAAGSHDNVPVTHRYRFLVQALARRDGGLLWQRTLCEEFPHDGGHYSGSHASHSAVTDGERVYAYFGSRGIYCLDVDGRPLWRRRLGEMQTLHGHGEGSSPTLAGKYLIVNWDHEGESFITAIHGESGETIWRTDRDEVTSWGTPLVVEQRGRRQVIVSATNRIRAYDLETGAEIWQCGGMSTNVVASPVAGEGMIFAGSSYEKQVMLAIRLADARGDITGTEHVVWQRTRGTPYVPSPLLYEGGLYFLRHYQGILSRVEPLTGNASTTPLRLPGIKDVYASPVAADGRIYITDLTGTTVVLQHGPQPTVIATNRLDDEFAASAALVDDELYLRGAKYLYCIAD